jgi:hypothetical protein
VGRQDDGLENTKQLQMISTQAITKVWVLVGMGGAGQQLVLLFGMVVDEIEQSREQKCVGL